MVYDISRVDDFVEYLYGRLPQIYRTEDDNQNNFLYKYLYALVKGGYSRLINSHSHNTEELKYDETGNIVYKILPTGEQVPDMKSVKVTDFLGIKDLVELVNPLTCPEELFPFLYESFGLTYFNDIDIAYQRRFLNNIGFMNRIKGTITEANFICSILTNMKNDAWYEKDFETGDRYLRIILYADNIEDIKNIKTSGNIVQRFLKTRIPFYLEPLVSVQVRGEILVNQKHFAEKLVISKGYTLYEKEVN